MATKDTDPVVPSTQPRTSQGEAASGLPEAVVFPYTTPVPAPTTNGANGFRWCHECQSVADVAEHECASAVARALASPAALEHMAADLDHWVNIANANEARAELAENLLTALAFDHGTQQTFISFAGHRGLVMCRGDGPLGCPFCDAARGGGR